MGEKRSLDQILQELVDHCNSNGDGYVNLTLSLPEKTLEAYSTFYRPIERIGPSSFGKIQKLSLKGGSVEFI